MKKTSSLLTTLKIISVMLIMPFLVLLITSLMISIVFATRYVDIVNSSWAAFGIIIGFICGVLISIGIDDSDTK